MAERINRRRFLRDGSIAVLEAMILATGCRTLDQITAPRPAVSRANSDDFDYFRRIVLPAYRSRMPIYPVTIREIPYIVDLSTNSPGRSLTDRPKFTYMDLYYASNLDSNELQPMTFNVQVPRLEPVDPFEDSDFRNPLAFVIGENSLPINRVAQKGNYMRSLEYIYQAMTQGPPERQLIVTWTTQMTINSIPNLKEIFVASKDMRDDQIEPKYIIRVKD